MLLEHFLLLVVLTGLTMMVIPQNPTPPGMFTEPKCPYSVLKMSLVSVCGKVSLCHRGMQAMRG